MRDTKDGVVAVAEYKAKPQIINIPLGDNLAVMQIPVPLDEEAWDLMLGVLNAMKAGIVRKKVDTKAAAATDDEAPE